MLTRECLYRHRPLVTPALIEFFFFHFFFTDPATTKIYTLSLHDALPIYIKARIKAFIQSSHSDVGSFINRFPPYNKFSTFRSEEHTSELQSRGHLVCRLLLEKKKTKNKQLSQIIITN